MADEGSKVVTFQSNDGNEYIVTYFMTTNMNNRYLNICIRWNADLNVVVMVELLSLDSNPSRVSKYNIAQGKQTSTQLTNFSPFGLCVINVIPLSQSQNYQDYNASKLDNKILEPEKKGTVIEKKFDKLSTDMQKLLLKSDLSDVILSDGSSDFPAHKLMLSARSPVFEKMFQHSMKEKFENRVIITDISADVLKELLSYIYTGIICIKEGEMARNLYVAADKYDIQDLKDVCSVYLKNTHLDSVLDTLILANLYGDKTLKQCTMDFIAKNFSRVEAHHNWEKFMKENQGLTIEVLSSVVKMK